MKTGETKRDLSEIAQDLRKHIKSGKGITEFSFESLSAEERPWQEGPLHLDNGALTHSIFVSYPHFRLPARPSSFTDMIIIDSDLSGLGHSKVQLTDLLIAGSRRPERQVPVESGEDLPIRLECPGRKGKPLFKILLDLTKIVEGVAGKESICELNLPFAWVEDQLAGRGISLSKNAPDPEARSCLARGICLEDCRINGVVIFQDVDLTACCFQCAEIAGLLRFTDCLLDGACLGSILLSENASVVIESSSTKKQDIGGIVLSGAQKTGKGSILLHGVRIRDSVIGGSAAGRSSTLALADGTDAEISQSLLTDLELDLSQFGSVDNLVLDSCQITNVTITGLHHVVNLKNCGGRILLRNCTGATLAITGSAERMHLELVDCERVSIIALDGSEISLALTNSSLGNSLQILSSPALEFTHFDEKSSISIEDKDSSLRGSKVMGLVLPHPKSLLIGSEASLDLTGTMFMGCSLQGAILTQSKIGKGTEFHECDLSGSALGMIDKVHFLDCDLHDCTIQKGFFVHLSGKTKLLGLKVVSQDLYQFTFDEIPEEEIRSLDLDGKYLQSCSFKGVLPDLVLSGTIFESCSFSPKQLNSWSIRARSSTLPRAETGIDSDTPAMDAIQIRGTSLITEGTKLNDASFCGCNFESSSFWSGAWVQHLSVEMCDFASGAITLEFPWPSVDEIHNCRIRGAKLLSTIIKANLRNVRFADSHLEQVSISTKGKIADIHIGENSIIDGLCFTELDDVNIHVNGSKSCNSLIVDENRHVGTVSIEKTPIESLRIRGSSRIEENLSSVEVISIQGSQNKSTLARGIELFDLNGTRLDLRDLSLTKLVINNSQFSPDSSVSGVSANGSSLSRTNLLGLPSGRISDVYLDGSSLTSIELTGVLSDHMERGLTLLGCNFSQCRFGADALLNRGQNRKHAPSFEGSTFDSACEFTQKKMVGPVIFDGCIMRLRMDNTAFLDCSFKGSVFSVTSEESRTIRNCCFKDCEFDSETKLENCTIVGSDSYVFRGKESGPQLKWHPRFRDVVFETMTLDGAQFSGSEGTLVFRYCDLLNCHFNEGPSELEFLAGSVGNTTIECKSLEGMNAYSTDFSRVIIEDLSSKANFTFRQCNIDLKFVDRQYAGKARFTICQLVRLALERECSINEPIMDDEEHVVPAVPVAQGEFIIEKCRIERPTRQDSLALTGYTKESPPTFTLEVLLYGMNVGDIKSHLLEIGKLRPDLSKKDWVVRVEPDNDWYDQLLAEMGSEGLRSGVSEPEVRDEPNGIPFGGHEIEALKSLVLQRLASIRHYEWQATTGTDELNKLLLEVERARITPGILSSDAQEVYMLRRQELIEKIQDRISVVEGIYDSVPETKKQFLIPHYFEQPVRDLLTTVSLSVGTNAPSSNEPQHIKVFLKDILAKENFKLISPSKLSSPVPDGRAFLYLDTIEFGKLLKNKILHNIRKHVTNREAGLQSGIAASPVAECGVNLSSRKDGPRTLLYLTIWDSGAGFGKRQDEVRSILNTEKYAQLRAFCAKFCSEFRLRTKCSAKSDGEFIYSEFFLKSDGKIDFSPSQAKSVDRGTEYVFCFRVEVS